MPSPSFVYRKGLLVVERLYSSSLNLLNNRAKHLAYFFSNAQLSTTVT